MSVLTFCLYLFFNYVFVCLFDIVSDLFIHLTINLYQSHSNCKYFLYSIVCLQMYVFAAAVQGFIKSHLFILAFISFALIQENCHCKLFLTMFSFLEKFWFLVLHLVFLPILSLFCMQCEKWSNLILFAVLLSDFLTPSFEDTISPLYVVLPVCSRLTDQTSSLFSILFCWLMCLLGPEPYYFYWSFVI